MLEILTIFFSSILLVITLFISGIIITKTDKKKTVNIKTILIILVAALLNTIIFKYTANTAKTILTCILYIATLKHTLKLSLSKSTFLGIVYVIILIIPDIITLGIAIYIFNLTKEYCYDTIAGSLISNLCVNLLMIIFIYIIRKPLRKLMNYKVSENIKIILISSLTLVTLALFFYNLIKTYEFNNNIFRYLIVILSLIIIIFYLFKQKIDNENILKRYDVMLNTIGEYEKDIEEQRKLIHETRNELMTVRCKLLDKSSKEDIFEYLDSLMGDKVSGKMSNYSKFNYLPPNGLKGFLYYKFMEAEKEGVNAIINVSEGVKNSFLKDLDTNNFKSLGRILGVYLDNAIEASAKSEEKKLGVEIYIVKGNIRIIISNTYNNKINLDKMGNERISTKGRNRGHGLLLVSKILSENKIFNVKSTAKNGVYIQELTIENPVK